MDEESVLATEFNGLLEAQPTLPSYWYFDARHFERECREIWQKSWVYLSRSDSLPQAGSYRTLAVAGQDLVLVRGKDDRIRGFFNTCRHRGSTLCTEASGTLDRSRIVCPYHQWTYAMDGRLLATGAMRRIAGFDRADYGLLPIAIEEWGGFIFANLAGEKSPLFLEAVAAELDYVAKWPMADLLVGQRYHKVLDCNWKIFWENFNECLHCPNVHPELCELVPIYGRGIMTRRDDPDWSASASDDSPLISGRLREGAETWSVDGRAQDMLAGLTDAERTPGHRYATLLPSVFIAAHLDYVRVVRLMPLTAERTELSAEWLFHPRTLARPDFDMRRITEFGTLVMEQDGAASELNQRGLKATAFDRGVLMQEEYEVFLFQDWVREALGEPRRGASAGSRASRRTESGG